MTYQPPIYRRARVLGHPLDDCPPAMSADVAMPWARSCPAAAAAVRSRSSVRSIRRCGQAENAKEGEAQLIRNSGVALVNLNKEPLDL